MKTMSLWDMADQLKADKRRQDYETRYGKAEQAKQQGVEASYRHADSRWKQEASAQLHEIIKKQEFFTSDDILEPLEARGIVTRDNRAIAAILQAFNRSGMITSTDMFVRCRRPSRHGAPIMKWKSNVYRKVKND